MDKEEIKLRRNMLKESNAKYTADLAEVPKEEWPEDYAILSNAPKELWRSNKLLVQVFEENNCMRITVNRTAINSDGSYKDGLTWDDLQAIKRHVGFGDKDAIEIYPADRDIVNVANMRHLWVMPSPISCAWRNTPPEAAQLNTTMDQVSEAAREYQARTGHPAPKFVMLTEGIFHKLRGEIEAELKDLKASGRAYQSDTKKLTFEGMEIVPVESLPGGGDIQFGHEEGFMPEGGESNIIPVDFTPLKKN